AKFIQSHNDRYLSVGQWFLVPNALGILGARDFGLMEAAYPKRYFEFVRLAGAHRIDGFFWQYFPPLSPILDCAGIKYFLSADSPWENFENGPGREVYHMPDAQPPKIVEPFSGLRLRKSESRYYPSKMEVVSENAWQLSAASSHSLFYRLSLV